MFCINFVRYAQTTVRLKGTVLLCCNCLVCYLCNDGSFTFFYFFPYDFCFVYLCSIFDYGENDDDHDNEDNGKGTELYVNF